jgi:Protein phosphatase 2C
MCCLSSLAVGMHLAGVPAAESLLQILDLDTPPPCRGQVTMLTADHRWTSTEERARLAGMGIQLEGRTRLYGLNLSRCLGDKFLKVAAACRS